MVVAGDGDDGEWATITGRQFLDDLESIFYVINL